MNDSDGILYRLRRDHFVWGDSKLDDTADSSQYVYFSAADLGLDPVGWFYMALLARAVAPVDTVYAEGVRMDAVAEL
mgnify:FL=1